jgi:hypothetical protein
MSSTEQLLATRKSQMADKIAQDIVDAWLGYLETLDPTQRAQVRSLDGPALNQQLRTVYAAAKKEQAVAGWKLNSPSQTAETEVRNARADATKADNLTAFLAELATRDWFSEAGGGGYLYRNVGDPVTPAMVLGQGEVRGPRPLGDPTEVLGKIYRAGADSVIEGYVRSNEMFAGGEQVACTSLCDDPASTLGRGPVWKFAVPTPALSPIPPETIADTLGVSASAARNLKQGWSLMSSTGGFSGLVAFVCGERANEHIFLTGIPIDATHAFRKYQGAPYQCQWKKLTAEVIKDYFELAASYGLEG